MSDELAKKQGRNDINAIDGWLSRWKARHNTKFEKAVVEKANADNEKNFCGEDIYNADEIGLCYLATPHSSIFYKHIALPGYKMASDRFTVLCCSNMSGTHKRKLLIIRKSARPRCFNGIRMEGLP
ncbi:hypothetical protein RF11_16178 [Thelohanellus kitauei]|uniref:HTH CENPB-type domain-containing protein n=1 Tax=Thelohanellus kitauei TaxID=669202 RepID=A0A0C2JYH5_THEKT|nr:hypothetical protein RF11_16178 [Thelohanellus kitauei]